VPAGRIPRRFTACLVALLGVWSLAHGEFQDDYALGLKSIDDGRYADAQKYLERALQAQSEPVDKVILNGNVEQPYLPYHFLGIAHYKLGECDAAKAQWDNPTNQRMIGRLNPIRRLEQRLAAGCKPLAAEAAKEQAAPVPPVTAVEKPTQKPPVDNRERSVERPPAEPAKPPVAETDRVPPPRLVGAVDSYLAGHYADAARVLPDSFPAARARFHAFLIRSAARFTLAQIDGDKELLAAARADAKAAQALDLRAEPDAALFSPKFRAFYSDSR